MSDTQMELTVQTVTESVSPDAAEATNLLAIIGRAAFNPAVDVEKMRALLELKERIDEKEAKQLFQASMIAAQEEMRPIVRDRENDHTHSKYATLEAVERAIRPIYTKHGFVLSFNSRERSDGYITMCATCMHRGGYSKDYELTGALDSAGPSGKSNKTGIQAAGSTVSYLRRYLLMMIFNLVLTNEDNDGQGEEKYITHDQVNRIRDLLIACELDQARTNKFFEYIGAKDVEYIRAADFRRAEEALKAQYKAHQKAKGI